MALKVNVILFDININGTVVKEVLDEQAQRDPENTTIEKFKTVAETIQYYETIENAIILFVVSNGDSLLKLVDLTKKLKPMMKKGFLKVCGFNDINNQKVDLVLKKAGITDILDPTINKKTFQYKLNFWAKSLRKKEVKKLETVEGESKENVEKKKLMSGNKAAEKTPPAGKKNRGAINQKPALDLEEDCWLLKSKEDCKLILNKWLIRLLGPGPGVCKWDQVKDKNNPNAQVWKFGPRRKEDSNDQLFFFEDGAWFFVGQKPEFEWKTNRWIFTANKPSLIYVKGEEQFSRFVVEDNGIDLADNSVFAKTKEESIWQTIEMEKDFNNEDQKGKKPEELKIEDEGQADAGADETTQLSAFSEDDRKKKGKFSDDMASSDSSEDANVSSISFSDLEAEPEDLGGHYSGEGETEHITDEPLSGETDGTDHFDTESEMGRFENEEGEIEGHLEGEGQTEKINSGPLKGKIKKGGEKKSFGELEGSFESEEYEDGTLEGDIGTEKINGGPLKGKIKKGGEKKSFGELEGSFESEEYPDGTLEGDIGTEQISGGALKGKISKGAKKKSFGELEGSFESEEYPDGTLEGDIGTEEVSDGALKGKIKTEKKKNKPLRGAFGPGEAIEGELEGDFEEEEISDGLLAGDVKTEKKSDGRLKGKLSSFADLEEESEEEVEEEVEEEIEQFDEEGKPLPPKKVKTKRKKLKKKAKKRMKRVDPITGNFVDNEDADGEEGAEGPFDDDSIPKMFNTYSRRRIKLKKFDWDNSFEEEEDEEEYLEDGSPDMPMETYVGDISKPVKIKKKSSFASLEGENEEEVSSEEAILDEEAEGDNSLNMPETDLDESAIPESLSDSSIKTKGKLKDFQLKEGQTRYRGFAAHNRDDKKENPFDTLEEPPKEEPIISLEDILDQTIDDLNLESGEMTIMIERLDEDGAFLELKIEATLDDLYENSLVIKTFDLLDGLKVMDQVRATLTFNYEGKDVSVVIEGLVETLDEIEGETEVENEIYLTIKLSKVNQEEMDNFLTHYSGRQNNIVKFMKMTKGDAA